MKPTQRKYAMADSGFPRRGGRGGTIPKGRRCQPIIRQYLSKNCMKTRMHSSRMRTARSSSHLLRGACHSACWDTYHPLPTDVGLETPPGQTPQLSPLGVGLETCNACWNTTSNPPVDRNLQCMLGYHPHPCEQND